MYSMNPMASAVPYQASPYAPFAGAMQSIYPQSGGFNVNLRSANAIMSGNDVGGLAPSNINAQIPGDFLFNGNKFAGAVNLNGNIGGNANISNNIISWLESMYASMRPAYPQFAYRPQPRPMPMPYYQPQPVAYQPVSYQAPVSQAIAFAGQYGAAAGNAGVQNRY